MLKRLLLLLCVTVTFCYSLCAQETFSLKGQVIDKNSKEALAFCTVVLSGTKKSTYTNEKGGFAFKQLIKGNYDLRIIRTGYKEYSKQISLSANIKTMTVELEEGEVQLDEVTVIGESENTKIETEGFAVKSISTEKVKLQSIEVNTLLDQTPGFTVRQSGGLGSRASYAINGLSGNAVRFFIDGVPMEYYGSSYSVSSLPVSLIENMEIYKGVVPVHLGSDALGGAINIRTRMTSGKSLNTSYSVGSFNTHQVALNGGWKDENSGFQIRGSSFYNYSDNNYKVWGEDVYVSDPVSGRIDRSVSAERFNDAYENIGAKVDVGFTERKWADHFFISMLYADKYREIQHGATMEVPFSNRFYTQQSMMPSLNYKKSDFVLKGLDVSLFTAYSIQTRQVVDTATIKYNWHQKYVKDIIGGGEQNLSLAVTDEATFINRINLMYHIDSNNKLSFNQVYTVFNRISDDEMAEIGKRTYDDKRIINKNLMGISLENNSFDDRLKLNIFGKYYAYTIDVKDTQFDTNESKYIPYYYDKEDINYGYGIASSFKLTENWLLQVSYEKAVRLPKPNEIFGNEAESTLSAYELKPEKSENINLGLRYGTLYFGKHSLTMSSNLFYRNVTDLMQRSTERGTGYSYYENFSKILSKGIDLQVDYKYGKKLSLMLSTSYTDARDKDPTDNRGDKNQHYNSRLKNEPYFQVNTNARYKFNNLFQKNSQLNIYWSTRFVHEYFRSWENIGAYDKDVIPTQFVNNIGATYRFPDQKIALSLDLKNLFNEQVFDNYALQLPGRGIYLKLNYKVF